jgi:hypothetical protein
VTDWPDDPAEADPPHEVFDTIARRAIEPAPLPHADT